ncbi:hypothetical protein MU1_12090 [Paenibacillus glycanilyticus]|uniref:Uncharacterized protein n=1 Tax=Paenibacillus glycanilyticus TaxID=126569 RepID=A0ABQ6G9Z5_9BACL|nr:hypothetical protein MU1_12090 [Paenibacillus glycanilyticus]
MTIGHIGTVNRLYSVRLVDEEREYCLGSVYRGFRTARPFGRGMRRIEANFLSLKSQSGLSYKGATPQPSKVSLPTLRAVYLVIPVIMQGAGQI